MTEKKFTENSRLIHQGLKVETEGSITVEAAFVMPIIIFTIFTLIYLAFYLHDYCRIQGAVDKVLHKAALTVKHEADIITGEVDYEAINDRGAFYLIADNTKEIENQIINNLKQELADSLFLSKKIHMEVEAGKLEITISIETEAKVSLPYFQRLFTRLTALNIQDNCTVHSPAETIRCAEVILDTGSNIKGVEVFKEKLKKYIESE